MINDIHNHTQSYTHTILIACVKLNRCTSKGFNYSRRGHAQAYIASIHCWFSDQCYFCIISVKF